MAQSVHSTYEIRLRSRTWSLVLLTALCIPSLLLIWETSRIVLAQVWASFPDPAAIEKAIALDPANPDLRLALGKMLLLDAKPGAQAAAEQEFRMATNMNPRSALYWAALGKACYSSGNQACADAAFLRARELAPAKPQFAWQAAVNYVVSHQPNPAIENLRAFLQLQPDGLDQTLRLLMRGFGDPGLVMHSLFGTSSDAAAKLKFLAYLATDNDFDAATAYWAELVADKTFVPVSAVSPYVDGLLAGGRYREAARVWKYAVSETELGVQGAGGRQNLVFNGGFEQDPLNSGFDWHFWQPPYVDLDFADYRARTGERAFRIDFTVPQNSEYELAYQLVPVVPGQSYELTAFVSSQGITSDSGPRLRVMDPKCVTCLNTATQATLGTSDWHQTTARFTTGPDTEIVRLSVWRPRSRSYPMEISGQAWFDDVSLRPIPATAPDALQ